MYIDEFRLEELKKHYKIFKPMQSCFIKYLKDIIYHNELTDNNLTVRLKVVIDRIVRNIDFDPEYITSEDCDYDHIDEFLGYILEGIQYDLENILGGVIMGLKGIHSHKEGKPERPELNNYSEHLGVESIQYRKAVFAKMMLPAYITIVKCCCYLCNKYAYMR